MKRKVLELVVMGGGYPSDHSWNVWGSDPGVAAHVMNTWEGRVVFVGDDVGKYVQTGKLLMDEGPTTDPVRMAYIYYSYFRGRASWDPLAIVYAAQGLGDLFELGNDYGHNYVEPNGTNRWIWDVQSRNQFFLRLRARNETAAAEIDRLFLDGASNYASQPGSKAPLGDHIGSDHEEL